ncbi:MAG: efflux RND transporter periplasmic adaptor subunit [Selenomonadaceae bacterium]|nr:efflux RND transporter periplasmic adaptor subunit [Selenomonadaceae bacterium]
MGEGFFVFFPKKKLLRAAIITAVISSLFTGCGSQEQKQMQAPKQQVKVMKVVQRDAPLSSEYAGQLIGTEEVKVQSKISGNVVEKFVVGGQYVEEGQLLFRIDDRQYKTSILQAQADLAQTEVNLKNAEIDLQRYQMLLKENAVDEKTVTTQEALVRSYDAAAGVKAAAIRLAEENLADTNIYAPMSGQLGVDDVAVGTFVSAGQTNLVTIGSLDPIFAQFSISENEYLKFMTVQSMSSEHNPMQVSITLSDGKEYPFVGRIVETDRELANNTGSLTMKAIFPNHGGLLMPGMFARVKLTGETIPNAILVPQRAVQQLLGKSFVMTVGDDGKSKAKNVEIGQKIGSYYIITSGLTGNENIIVEGLTGMTEGVELAVTNVTPGEMGFTLANVTTPYKTDVVTSVSSSNANAPANVNR